MTSRATQELFYGSKSDWPMKGHVNQSKKVGGRKSEEVFGQTLFCVSPTPQYVPRKTKIEPDRKLFSF